MLVESLLRKELPTMKLITESALFVLLLCCCCCCLRVNATCWVECLESQRNLSDSECFLKDDGTSHRCTVDISECKKVTVFIDLTSTVQDLTIANSISSLKISAFRLHSEITSLHISKAFINTVLFYLLPQLTNLSLWQVTFPHFSYSNPLLTRLEVHSFSFTYPKMYKNILWKGRVSGLSQLNYLYLWPSQFSTTTDHSFSGLTALTFLYLGRFHIPKPVATFSPLVKLAWLMYPYSKLTDISFLSLTPSLFGLTYLSFEDNKITHIPTNVFLNYTNLIQLDLEHNEIITLEKDCFKGLIKLVNLHLNSNQLKELSTTVFRGLRSLTFINLSYNSISHLSSKMFESLKNLELFLYGSPLCCDCSLQWMSKIFFNYIYLARCATPPQYSGNDATDSDIYVNCPPESVREGILTL